MRQPNIENKFMLASAAVLAGTLAIAGCHNSGSHPDEKQSVTSSLNSNGQFSGVSVSQDRDKGVMTLKGDVASDDLKAQAETAARQAAPDYTIADEIGVRPPGEQSQAKAVSSDLDSAIEDNFKASIKAHAALDDQGIHGSAHNGTLLINGTVKTFEQKSEAEQLAKMVPNVQQVVNEIEINTAKHSSSGS
jgi:hyperosmotically inducible protein